MRTSVPAPRPEVSVVIGTYNRLRFLKATLESVRDELCDLRHEIIVVDGGSTDGTLPWLVEQKDTISIVQHNRGEWRGRPIERRSWGYFMNLGFKCAQADAICMLSDDCVVVPRAIRNGLLVFRAHVNGGERVGGVAFYWRNWPTEQDFRVGFTWGGKMFVNHGLYSREALEAVGYVDESSFGFYHADGDLGLRMWEDDLICIDSPHSFVEHYADATPLVRSGNLAGQRADWKTYEGRWSHLGKPAKDWQLTQYQDTLDTAPRYWGRVVTHPAYRLASRIWATSRILFDRARGRG